MKSSIITIGDEILIGQITDTNSASISRHLNSIGIEVGERLSVGDNSTQITDALTNSMRRFELTIITGGLGPTKDDITKITLAHAFGCGMREDSDVATHVKELLAVRGIPYNELNASQAQVPELCTVLFNHHGSAPGMWFEHDGRVVISLPGVPFEMEHLMEDQVLPRLKERFALHQIVHRTLITSGLPESMLAKQIEAWEDALPPHLKLAYLPNAGSVRLRLSAYDVDGAEVSNQIERQFDILQTIIPNHIVGFQNATIQGLLHDLLTQRGETLSVAESCTGGALTARLTALAGASAYFLCGVVAYANSAKCSILNVDAKIIEQHGAVSQQVAIAMAEGVRRATGSHYGLSTTGIAGPTGGSEQKPVGSVWIGVATPTQSLAILKHCGTDRSQIIERASVYALELLKVTITQDNFTMQRTTQNTKIQ